MFFRELAEEGHIWSINNYAVCLARGIGVNKGLHAAMSFYELTSERYEGIDGGIVSLYNEIIEYCENIVELRDEFKNLINKYIVGYEGG